MQQQQQQPPQPSSNPSGVTIVNGAPASSQPAAGDHSRKPSVTITSAGTSGYIPNGGPSSRPNSLQFGFANQQQSSPNMGNPAVLANQQQQQQPQQQAQAGLGVAAPVNPRVTSPQTSPSPIPQPASSGGRPPSSYQSQGNVPSFGSFGDAGDANVSHLFLFSRFLVAWPWRLGSRGAKANKMAHICCSWHPEFFHLSSTFSLAYQTLQKL